MSHAFSIARKELRSFFNSSVALIFLGVFLAVTVFTFFWVEKFFARGLADIRPMFEWFPIVLILLVAALTMRLWSEEQKSGTIEILLTLPIQPRELVFGKFLAGLLLIAMALLLTLPIPITVSMMGELDWGPVFGGYLAALLLGATYLSIGLCVSSVTDNQIVSLFGTGLVCGLLYLVGSEPIVSGLSVGAAEVLRSLGTGSRFQSVARGVLDLRDLVYYGSFVVFFLATNVVLIHAKGWSKGSRAAGIRNASLIGLVLALANVVALNCWLSPISNVRLDLTEDRIYSLSPATDRILKGLDESLLIRAYVSANVHPKVDPLIPELFDLLREYEERANGKVVLEFVDPDDDDALQKEAEENYQIKSDQFEITTRNKQALVNAYFRVLVEYGDKSEILGFKELLHILPTGVGEVEVKLGNVEYELTKAIRKSMQGFQDLDAVFASIGKPVELKAYISEDSTGDQKTALDIFDKVAEKFIKRGKGQFQYKKEIPKTKEEKNVLAQKYGIQPFSVLRQTPQGGMGIESFYFHLLLQVGDQAVMIAPPKDMSEETLEKDIESAIRQSVPGFIKTIGLVTPPAPPSQNPQMQMQMGRRPPSPPQTFQQLHAALAESSRVVSVDLDRPIDSSVDVLVVAGPNSFDDKKQRAIDQYLMQGGAVIILAGSHRLDLQNPGLRPVPIDSGLRDQLKSYGIVISEKMVLDENAGLFARVDLAKQRLEPMKASYLVEIPRDGLDTHLTTANLAGLGVPFARAIELSTPEDQGAGYVASALFHGSDRSWLAAPSEASNNPSVAPLDAEASSPIIAAALSASFSSYFAKKEKKKMEEKMAEAKVDDIPSAPGEEQRLLKQSPPGTRLVFVGSSSMFADAPLQLMGQLSRAGGTKLFQNNIPFLLNLVDWAVEDTELLMIRARFSGARILEVDSNEQSKWEYLNYGLALTLILGLFGFTLLRRRTLVAMELTPREEISTATTGKE